MHVISGIVCADLLLYEEYHTVIHELYDRHVKGKGLRQKVRQLSTNLMSIENIHHSRH